MSGLRILMVIAVALALGPQTFAKKTREWQVGTVLDLQHSPYYTESTTDAPYGGKADVPLMNVYDPFLIENETTVYFVREGRRFERTKPANLKPGDAVKLAIEGEKMYVLDANGKQHRMEITKQVPRAR
jgi:hypothetical protein